MRRHRSLFLPAFRIPTLLALQATCSLQVLRRPRRVWSTPVPELMPERMQERRPNRMPNRMSECVCQKACQKDCQIECENICQIECQKNAGKMPDRMSEYTCIHIPYILPDDMSSTMSEWGSLELK